MGRLLLMFVLIAGSLTAWAEDTAPYSEGDVVNVSYLRTHYGMFDEYMRFLAGPYRKLMEEEKKQGLILDYGVYSTNPRSPHDPDIMLVVRYRNWAALDGLRPKEEAILAKVFGSVDAADKGAVDRDKIREPLGEQFFQELRLK